MALSNVVPRQNELPTLARSFHIRIVDETFRLCRARATISFLLGKGAEFIEDE